jgi:hypothetical protein
MTCPFGPSSNSPWRHSNERGPHLDTMRATIEGSIEISEWLFVPKPAVG